jgi:LPS export ABC transporter protein LptC
MIEFFMKKVLLIGLSVLFFGILFLMLETGKDMNGEFKIAMGSFIEDITITQKKNGLTVWTLWADKANFSEDESRAELSDINIVLPDNGLLLYADSGVYNLSDRSFTTDSIVKAEGKDYKITTDSINYEISSGKIETAGRVIVEGRGFRVEGRGMKSDSAEEVTILNDVKATFNR